MTPEEYDARDALGLAHLVRQGEVTPEELLDLALALGARVDRSVQAVAIGMEKEARAAIERGLPDGPFQGVPFLVKDLACHMAGVRTTNGCRLFADFVPEADSELTRRYRKAGLVVFGKSASPEFGITTCTESTLFGETRNPWNLDHTPGGSSGGAAAAVAAGLTPLCHASDGGGSIRIPASCCGLFGLKPTRARIPLGPQVGEGWSGMSTVHAVSRSVRDSAALLDASAGPMAGDPYWAPPPARPYLEEVGAPPGRLRIALQRSSWNGVPVHADCTRALEDAAQLLAELGHEVVEQELVIDGETLGSASRVIIFANLRSILEDRARELGRALGEEDVEPGTWIMLQATASQDAADYARAIRAIHGLGRQVGLFFEGFDGILSPTMATPPLKVGELALTHPNLRVMVENLMLTTAFTQLFNAAGNPAMSVPLSWNGAGLPVGVQVAGRFGDEATLLRLAAQLEEARPWFGRRPELRGGAEE